MIADTITAKIGEALKAKDEIRLSTLRMLSSALNYEKIAKQHDLNEDEEIAVVKKEAKKRTDAIDALKLAQGKKTTTDAATLVNRLETEQKELSILKEYLPEEISDSELEKFVDLAINEARASSVKDMGRVIGLVMGKAKGKADGGKVAAMVKEKLVG